MDVSGPLLDGTEMPASQMSKAIYAMQRKVESVEKWAGSFNTALVDHAGHIDLTRMFATAVSSQLETDRPVRHCGHKRRHEDF